jgi:hypothetical protein
MAGDRPAYRIHAARGDVPWAFLMMYPAAVAVVDADLGIVLSLTSYLGGKPVRRYELRDVIATRADDFRVNIPPDLPAEPEANPRAFTRDAGPSHPGTVPLKMAGALAREVGREAAKAARNFLRRRQRAGLRPSRIRPVADPREGPHGPGRHRRAAATGGPRPGDLLQPVPRFVGQGLRHRGRPRRPGPRPRPARPARGASRDRRGQYRLDRGHRAARHDPFRRGTRPARPDDPLPQGR